MKKTYLLLFLIVFFLQSGATNSLAGQFFTRSGFDATWVSQTSAGTENEYFNVHQCDVVNFEAKFRNTGTLTWQKDGNDQVAFNIYKDWNVISFPKFFPYNLQDSQSYFYHSSWLSQFRIAAIKEAEVVPGDIGTVAMQFQVPCDASLGFYREDISMAAGSYWMKNGTNGDPLGVAHIWVGFNVQNATPTLFSGKIAKLDKTLDLLAVSDTDYYSAGVFQRGKYAGYTRIIGIDVSGSSPASPTFIFATKDFSTFIIDKYTCGWTWNFSEKESLASCKGQLNPQKTFLFENLNTEFSDIIPLNKIYSLHKEELLTDTIETPPNTYTTILGNKPAVTDLLSSPYAPLKIYKNTLDTQKSAKEYLDVYSNVIVEDSTGLLYEYKLTFSNRLATYYKEFADYQIIQNSTSEFVSPPWLSTLGFSGNQVTSKASLYKEYDEPLPGGCGNLSTALVVKNISLSDLVAIGTFQNTTLYSLKDKNHPLYTAQFASKEYSESTLPSFATYVEKNPLLFMQDYWGRWVMVGEYDYILPGGCGKPVLYLYPEKPTPVKVQFTRQINFDVTIPTYTNQWFVQAFPDGTLVDLQPKETDCSLIDETKKGSEYAKDACKQKTYPYLYWAGQSYSGTYQKQTEGWIVSSNDIALFLSNKLEKIGLNDQERKDMLEYWVPALLKKQAPYYRLSFLQTQQVNQIAPMKLDPTPDTLFRIFLDWEPLQEVPEETLQPQQLARLTRYGFTVVEWGGLKR